MAMDGKAHIARSGLTKKAEPPPTRGVNRDSGTASANGGWLRRLVRRRKWTLCVHDQMHSRFLEQGIASHRATNDKTKHARARPNTLLTEPSHQAQGKHKTDSPASCRPLQQRTQCLRQN